MPVFRSSFACGQKLAKFPNHLVISILDGVRCPVVLRLEEDDGFVMIGDAYVECLSSELDLENRVDDIEDIQDITLH